MRLPMSSPLGRNCCDHRHLTRIALIPVRAAGDDDLLEDSVGSIVQDLTRVLTFFQLLRFSAKTSAHVVRNAKVHDFPYEVAHFFSRVTQRTKAA
jgi:hypothetical protein